ncbi:MULTISPECIES: ATP-binding cassette domain-containing protein [unclassified Ligilactobacillus]|uniref:ATP-binding cassette domain-containing protein n=1 Tax=unclassified Ligilactobacillus TaxID=2767920 RepID=UPI0038547B15
MTRLTVNNLTKTFNQQPILEDISFELTGNKIYGLLGRNGVGKSTLLNCICDRLLFRDGAILLDEQPLHNNSHQLHQIYLMNDNSSMYYGWETVLDLYQYNDVAYGNFNYEEAHRLAHSFQIDEHQRFKNLSTGLRTAAKLILAFCTNAQIILLDEPTLGLDAALRNTFYRELIKTYNERPRIFVLSTHLINEVQNLVEDVLVLDNARLQFNQSAEDLCKKVTQIRGSRQEIERLLGSSVNLFNPITVGQQVMVNVKTELLRGKNIPETVTVQPVDLQTAFITLTANGEE